MTTQIISTPGVVAAGTNSAHYVDWGSIIVGTVLAAAISLVLFTFGTGIGLSMVSPYEGEGTSKTAYFMALGLWTLWVILSSFMAGGYISGRLRRRIGDATEHEVEMRDGAHGLSVWALGIVAGAALVAIGVSGVFGGVAKVAGPAAATAAAEADENTFTVDALFRSAPDATQRTATQATATTAVVQTAPADPAAAGTAPPMTAAPAAPAPAPAAPERDIKADREEVGRLLTMGMVRGELEAADKTYVATLVAANTGLSQAEAEKRVNDVLAEVKRKADVARKVGIWLTFATAAALILGAAAAAWAATLGGKHRDEGTDFSAFWRWR